MGNDVLLAPLDGLARFHKGADCHNPIHDRPDSDDWRILGRSVGRFCEPTFLRDAGAHSTGSSK
eukprot:CAMPEP_0168854140 /NCGR_PEP_ID=MMETSP0727-20121128/13914_1 /TAXON_ID=265536 /ORGANISM="Amphiprora sp., Strain CCMP467" /LENGTH=63 /DNA_ID=CAMNT_0008908435 /DNA_START=74 /DNA_END=262 /DNA_ORIENTATION=-